MLRVVLVIVAVLMSVAMVGCTGSRGTGGENALPPGVNVELAEKGKQLFNTYACNTCHSVNGQAGIGPALNGIYGKQVKLEDGSTVTVDDAYLRESILNPDAKIVAGYPKGSMANLIQPFLPEIRKEENLSALVEYIKSLQ
ncbi:Cytochrome c2 iso-1 [bacterium HR27]|nr:Cytochrome c2 iso-1 [bacterium HR27]